MGLWERSREGESVLFWQLLFPLHHQRKDGRRDARLCGLQSGMVGEDLDLEMRPGEAVGFADRRVGHGVQEGCWAQRPVGEM